MKILFITPWYPDDYNPNRGIFVRDQAVALASGHEVHVIYARVDYNRFALYASEISHRQFEGVNEHYVVVRRSLPVINQLVFFSIAISETLKVTRGFIPDVIHGNIGYPGALWSWCVSRAVGKPFVITEHTRVVNNFRSWIHRLATLWPLRRARSIIAVSSTLARELEQHTGRPVVVIPNIIDFSKFPITALRPAGNCQIGFLGGLNTPVKGLDLLLHAIAGLEGDFTLHIGGHGKLLDVYMQLAQELMVSSRCVFHGFVKHTEVNAFMTRLNFFVSASRYESFGMAMVEAMGCGLPVLATNSGGPADFITPVNGILVEKENVSALRQGLTKMLKHHVSFDSEAIRTFAIYNYSYPRFIARMNDVYRSLSTD